MHSYYDSALPEIPADCETMPAPAEAATDIGADDGRQPLPLPWLLARWVVVLGVCCWGAYLITTLAPRAVEVLAPLFR